MATDINDRYKLIYTVPPSHLESTKDAIFSAGAGKWPGGKYTKVCGQIKWTGQFQPEEGSNPYEGAVGVLEKVEEVRVEAICMGRKTAQNVVNALRE